MSRNNSHVLIFAFCLTLPVLPAHATITATPTLSPSAASAQPVYTPVTITFGATDTGRGPVNYRLDVEPPGGTFQTVHDFNLRPYFIWAQNLVEGTYQLRITARDNFTGEQNAVVIPYIITSRVTGTSAVVTATTHPLVALFSAPACAAGATMQVVFYPKAETQLASATDKRPCGPGSMNFVIGGMYASTTYGMNYLVNTNGVVTVGPRAIDFTTGVIPANAGLITPFVKVPPSSTTSSEKLLLVSGNFSYVPYATDLQGTPVWYYAGDEPADELDRLLPGGTLLIIAGGKNTTTGSGLWGPQTYYEVLEQVDLAGYVVHETNVDRINEQLPMTTYITDFNHEQILLPNGHTLAIASNQLIVGPGVQGNSEPISVIGDVILDLDTNMQLAWYWNAFDHDGGNGQLDITRPSTLNNQCSYTSKGVAQLGCPPVLLTSPANDWLHGNSLQLQSDGSILMSLRHQDWLIDIDYANGTGTGDIFWRMGLDGDFTMLTTGQYPWFSHQHDAEFTLGGETSLTVLDNGDVRINEYGGDSRGMVLNVDIPNLTVSVDIAQDLGYFSHALGSAQLLHNGDYFFLAGDIPYKSGTVEFSNEYSPSGTLTDSQGALTAAYRAFRVGNLYTPPNGAGINIAP